VADVAEIPPHELASRKVVLAMRTIKQPARLSTSVGYLWSAYLAVLATLKLQFAQTVAIALGLVETIELPITRVVAPPLTLALTPLELQHWTATVIEWAIKLLAISFAWTLQVVVSAFYSALRGGRIFALALCSLIDDKGWSPYVEKLPGVTAPFNPDTSYLDEVVGYSLAAGGLAFQLTNGFSLPFPLSLLLLPLTIVEWILRWQITFGAPAGAPADAAVAGG